jgi:tRNA G37 N-methylase Trm5
MHGLDALLANYELNSEMENVHLVNGKTEQVIYDFAARQQADLINMGHPGPGHSAW